MTDRASVTLAKGGPRPISWLHWGCESEQDLTLKRKVFNTNVAALITAVSLASFAALYALIPNSALHTAIFMHTPFLAAVITVPWMNLARHAGLARWTLLVTVTGLLVFTIWTVSGSTLHVHYYFVFLALVVVTIVPIGEWPAIIGIIVVNLGLFAYCEFAGVAPAPELLSLDDSTVAMFRAVHTIAFVCTVGINFWAAESARSQHERSLLSLSQHDALTGLANRRRMEDRLSNALTSSRRTGQCGAIVFLDLDNFKPLNDAHGHAAGDFLLQEVGRRLIACVRESDEVARFGGDEFVVMLTNLGVDPAEARTNALRIAEKIRARLAEPYEVPITSAVTDEQVVEHRCSASLGLALFTKLPVSHEVLLKQADSAMYRAKDAGRNTVVLHAETITSP